jgi:DNA repair exonuclease SbcCD ATPase subunit
VVAIAIAGCDDNKMEVEKLNRYNDSLVSVTAMRDSVINDFMASFNEIEANLDSIASTQEKIEGTMEQGQLRGNAKDRIREDIQAIEKMMAENRDKVAQLSKKLKRSNAKLAQFEKTIERLNIQIAEKDTQMYALNERINGLNMEIASLNSAIDTLHTVNTTQADTIRQQVERLHTAYYVVGDENELESRQIVDKRGGVLGIGSTTVVASQLKDKEFTKIDYTQTLTIPVQSKDEDVKIATKHPATSYTIEKDNDGKVTNLKINDPDEFWSISKYLVVMKD